MLIYLQRQFCVLETLIQLQIPLAFDYGIGVSIRHTVVQWPDITASLEKLGF